MFATRAFLSEVVSWTNYGLDAADVAATRILLLQNYPRPRLEMPVLHPGIGTDATTHGGRDCHNCNRDDDRRTSGQLRLSHRQTAPLERANINGTVAVPRWVYP